LCQRKVAIVGKISNIISRNEYFGPYLKKSNNNCII